MSWLLTAPAIETELSLVADVGRVHLGERHLRDQSRVRALLGSPVEGERDRVRGWTIARERIEESWWSTLKTKATETYVLRAYQGLRSTSSSSRLMRPFSMRPRTADAPAMAVAFTEVIVASDCSRCFRSEACRGARA